MYIETYIIILYIVLTLFMEAGIFAQWLLLRRFRPRNRELKAAWDNLPTDAKEIIERQEKIIAEQDELIRLHNNGAATFRRQITNLKLENESLRKRKSNIQKSYEREIKNLNEKIAKLEIDNNEFAKENSIAWSAQAEAYSYLEKIKVVIRQKSDKEVAVKEIELILGEIWDTVKPKDEGHADA